MCRMHLRAFLSGMPPAEVDAFAARCECSPGHLRNVMYGVKACAADLAVAIERESAGVVTRPELRDDWPRYWPELVGTPDATKATKPPRKLSNSVRAGS